MTRSGTRRGTSSWRVWAVCWNRGAGNRTWSPVMAATNSSSSCRKTGVEQAQALAERLRLWLARTPCGRA